MNPAYLLSEWGFAIRRGIRVVDRWRLARNSFLGRIRVSNATGIELVKLRVEQKEVTVALRRGTDDSAVLMQVFHYHEYDTDLVDWKSVRTIVDAGANIGLSSLLFSRRAAPEARVLAIEPETSNLELLRMNLQELNGVAVDILPEALWFEPGSLSLSVDGASVSHSVRPGGQPGAGKRSVTAVTPAMLLDRLGHQEIDLFKIDIEGAEKDILTHPSVGQWVRSVRHFLIECHSHFGFGASPSEIEQALGPHGFAVVAYQPDKGLVCARRR